MRKGRLWAVGLAALQLGGGASAAAGRGGSAAAGREGVGRCERRLWASLVGKTGVAAACQGGLPLLGRGGAPPLHSNGSARPPTQQWQPLFTNSLQLPPRRSGTLNRPATEKSSLPSTSNRPPPPTNCGGTLRPAVPSAHQWRRPTLASDASLPSSSSCCDHHPRLFSQNSPPSKGVVVAPCHPASLTRGDHRF